MFTAKKKKSIGFNLVENKFIFAVIIISSVLVANYFIMAWIPPSQDPPGGITPGLEPQIYLTRDTRVGCPPAALDDTPLITQNLSIASDTIVDIQADIIRHASGRCDLYLLLDGATVLDHGLTYTSSLQWEDVYVSWSGQIAAGNHTISVRASSCADAWGCGQSWGKIRTKVYE